MALSNHLLQDATKYGKMNEYHEIRPIAALYLLRGPLIRSKAVRNTMTLNKEFRKYIDGSLGRSIVSANPYLEWMSIPVRAKNYPLHNGSRPV